MFIRINGILMISPLMISSRNVKVSQKRCLGTSIESFTGSSPSEQIIGKAIWNTKTMSYYQVIPGHGTPQKRRTMFSGYLFKCCCVKYQTFHQVCEKASQ